MKKALKNISWHLWGCAVITFGTVFVVYGSRFGIIFWPKWYNAPVRTMEVFGLILVSTFLLGSIYYYCEIVRKMEV